MNNFAGKENVMESRVKMKELIQAYNEQKTEAFKFLIEYLENNPNEEITLNKAANITGISIPELVRNCCNTKGDNTTYLALMTHMLDRITKVKRKTTTVYAKVLPNGDVDMDNQMVIESTKTYLRARKNNKRY